jgi:RND superfamily putative drug exporter
MPAIDGLWARVARQVMRYPVPVFLVVLLFLLFLASPFLRVQLGAPDARILPPDIPSRQAFDILQSEFGAGEATPLVLALEVSDGRVFDPQRIASLYALTRTIQQDPLVSRVDSLVTIDPRISLEQYQALFARPDLLPNNGIAQGVAAIASDRVTAVQIITPALTTSEEAKALVDRLRALPQPEGWRQPLVTGAAAGIKDIVDELYRELPRAIGFIVVATGISLLVLFRSVVVPIKAILMNLLSIGASFGALVFIFQDGNLSDLFRFQPLGYVDAFIPVILFCILFGLSMDYEVFLLSRIKEAYDATGDNPRSVEIGLERTGRVITSAALILVVVAASFALTDIILIKAIGLGVAIAIGLDATVVRTLLVPATMRLLGRWNWWAPSGLQRALGRFRFDHG